MHILECMNERERERERDRERERNEPRVRTRDRERLKTDKVQSAFFNLFQSTNSLGGLAARGEENANNTQFYLSAKIQMRASHQHAPRERAHRHGRAHDSFMRRC